MDVDALFKFYQENIAGTKYKSTSNFGKFLTQYVVCHGNLKDIWAKNDDHRAYWYRKVNDGIDRPSIMLAFDKVTGNLPEVMEDYYQNSSHRSEEAPVDWDDQYADIDLPNYQESSAKRRKWFDTVRVEAQARHQLAITALKKRDRGFAAEDYLKVVLLQNKVGFGNFIKHVEKFYQYKLRTEAVTTKTLQRCHLIFLEALANDIDTYKTKYEDIWSADTCIQWLDHRDVTEIDKFLGTVITTLLKFQKNDGD